MSWFHLFQNLLYSDQFVDRTSAHFILCKLKSVFHFCSVFKIENLDIFLALQSYLVSRKISIFVCCSYEEAVKELIFHIYFPQMLIQKLRDPKYVQNIQINLKSH